MGKRVKGNGDGSVFERKDRPGWVYASVAFEGKRKTSRHKTKAAANAWIRQELDKRDIGQLVMGKSPTVAAFLEGWLRDSAKPKLRASAFRGYEQLVRIHLVPKLGHVKLDKLSPAAVQAFQNQMLESGLAPATVRYARAVLRVALGQAVRWGLMARNPVDLVDGPRVETYEIQPFDLIQAQAFLAAVANDRLEALWSVALSLGLRQGEALGLRWQDIDLDGAQLRVRHQLQRVDRQLILVPTKTKRGTRRLSLPPSIVASLRAHRERQASQLGALPGPSSYVFTTRLGTPLEARNIVRRFKAILVKAGLPDKRFHDLRHSAGTFLIAQHVHPRVVMEILGHSSITVTMDIYGHVLPETMKDAAARMDAIFAQ
jgi:integrase